MLFIYEDSWKVPAVFEWIQQMKAIFHYVLLDSMTTFNEFANIDHQFLYFRIIKWDFYMLNFHKCLVTYLIMLHLHFTVVTHVFHLILAINCLLRFEE